MLHIADGRESFYQWDVNREIVVSNVSVTELHFCNGTSDCSLVCTVTDGRAPVPNILLQTAGKIRVYGYAADHTELARVFTVCPRTKPDDYVYTETDVKRYDALEKRIKALEENNDGPCNGIVEETDPTVANWAKQPEPPAAPVQSVNGMTGAVQLNAADVGALSVDAIKASASGAVVSVTDAAAYPAVGLVSHIEAVQEGSGDPSPDNIRPIIGWDRVQAKNDTSGQTITADLPETVYGGKLDWRTGVLTVTHGMRVYSGAEEWECNGAYFKITKPTGMYAANEKVKHICSHYICTPFVYVSSNNAVCSTLNQKTLIIKDTRYTTVEEWKTYLSEQAAAGTPLTIAYMIVNPYTIQLTPQQLDMLKGANTVWSDCGSTDIVYVADLQMYIDNKFAALAAGT